MSMFFIFHLHIYRHIWPIAELLAPFEREESDYKTNINITLPYSVGVYCIVSVVVITVLLLLFSSIINVAKLLRTFLLHVETPC